MERVFYKLLWVGLTLVTLSIVFSGTTQIAGVLAQVRLGFPLERAVPSIVFLTGQSVLAIAALYWVPRLVRQIVPEVMER